MKIVTDQSFDQERAFYGEEGLVVRDCAIDGPADGESAFKECRDVTVESTLLNLRYPFWHDAGLVVRDATMTEACRAALWYSRDVTIEDSRLHGIKALRECDDVALARCDVDSPEFGWMVRGARLEDCTVRGEYAFMRSSRLRLRDVRLEGKYTFQYTEDVVIENSVLDTKDAFWHAHGVTVRNSVIRGEYLGWYSDGLTLINCRIEGTQPLCYARNLTLVDCQMVGCDLAFEKSEVQATVTTPIDSVKNPASGTIVAPCVGELVMDDPRARGVVVRPARACA